MPVDISTILNLARDLVGKYTAPDKELQSAWERKDPRETAMRLANKINFAEGGVTAVPGASNMISQLTSRYIQPTDRMLANQLKVGAVNPENLSLGASQTASRLNRPGGEILVALERAYNQGDLSTFKQIGQYVLQNAKQFPGEIVSQVASTLRLGK